MCVKEDNKYIIIKSNIRNYKVLFQENFDFIKKLANQENIIFIIDENVWNIYRNKIFKDIDEKIVIIQKSMENLKTLDTVSDLYRKIMKYSPRKNLTLVSIGGGIIQDITGFIASSLYRGINWIFIPTTLLAQVDSCIGAKTSLNFDHYKNLIGTFYPPKEIYIYPEFLKTLSEEDFYSGLGEVAKLCILDGIESVKFLIENIKELKEFNDNYLNKFIEKALKIKKAYIETDEFDTGKRNMLNYGHCIGHGIESAVDFKIPHGQAVVIGMIIANKEALNRKLLSKKQEEYIYENLLIPILKVDLSNIKIEAEKVIKAMRQDKKNLGKGLALVMINDDCKPLKITDLAEDRAYEIIKDSLDNIIKNKESLKG